MSRIVVKIGSSSLTIPRERAVPPGAAGLDGAQIDALVDAVAASRRRGDEVVLVSSGAIAAGLPPLGLKARPRDLPTQQAAASVGQGLLVHRYTERFASHDIVAAQVLLTLDDITRRSHYRNAYQTFARLLELGVVPIVNENDTVATTEIRFGDNDRLAALVAHLVHADHLVLLSDVDGLYDRHPGDQGAEQIREVANMDELVAVDVSRVGSAVGTGGMVTKLEAARLATEAGIQVTLTSAEHAERAIAGEQVGTRFTATGKRRSTRLLWLQHASDTKGALHIDDGAWRALSERNASLLPAGITSVFGSFVAGDPVDVINEGGAVVARGIVTYDSDELPGLLGRSTRELAAELGADYEREVIHRDDLVLLTR